MPPIQAHALAFACRSELYPGEKLAQRFPETWPDYQRWFTLSKAPATALEGRAQLRNYMPELLSTYDAFCGILAADEQVVAFLSLSTPPAFRAGCSQAAWARQPLTLIRNYDFPAHLCERQLLHSNWHGTNVMAMTDCLWGVLDGMNEHGLAVSLAYGGNEERGDGFAITLVLRYVLEFCKTTDDAVAVLCRVPVHMPYNITVLDRSGHCKTVVICPGKKTQVTRFAFATNHQAGNPREDLDAVADSCEREAFLSTRLADPAQTHDGMLDMFLHPPLLRKASNWRGWGTLYTASYHVESGTTQLSWPDGQTIEQVFGRFQEQSLSVSSPAFYERSL